MTAPAEPPRFVVMGPSGAGKSVVGAALAERLAERFPGLRFVDADDLHPASNVEKMRAGIALDDHDRMPWLALVGGELAAGADGRVVACSALKRSYRDAIRAACPDAVFVELVVPAGELGDRVVRRPGHFMPASLVASQLGALEPLDGDERGIRIENTGPVDGVVTRVIAALDAGW
ncbi:gluconokinase [Agromyces bauzanensis]